jgi:hypothetical protein
MSLEMSENGSSRPGRLGQEVFPDGTKASAFYGEDMLNWGAACGGAIDPNAPSL